MKPSSSGGSIVNNDSNYDDIVIGAGILGQAFAYHLARRGRQVAVIERNARAEGASLRNLGMIWPIGQPEGELYSLALRSRQHWLTLAEKAGFWHAACGSLHVAYAPDEMRILEEYATHEQRATRGLELLHADQAAERCPWLKKEGLHVALWSPHEMCVDPRQVLTELPLWLTHELNVTFRFGTTALKIDENGVHTTAGRMQASTIWVCTGDDFNTLYPDLYAESGLFRCRVQMLRTQPQPSRMGPLIAAGLSLLQQNSFCECPTLPELRERYERELPQHLQAGIHVVAAQAGTGELTIGESHEYGENLDSPFLNGEIEELMLDYLQRYLHLPQTRIAQRWVSTYARHSYEPWLVKCPSEKVTLVNGLGSADMTLALGLADKLVRDKLFVSHKIELVVFDIAGTTVNDNNGVAACLRDALFDFGMQVNLTQINQVMGWPKPAAIRYLVENSLDHAARLSSQINMIHANFVTRMKRFYMHDPRVSAMPGAADVFLALRSAGIKVALNTSFSRDITTTILHRLGWKVGELIDAVISSDEVPRALPAPDMIHALMKKLGIASAKQVAKVGDTPIDIEEGLAAGCGMVIGVTSGMHKCEDLQRLKPQHVVASIREVPPLMPTDAEEP
jgi:FAD dependent oxidoreductase TIGR03364/phosphonatase-like hydrolase